MWVIGIRVSIPAIRCDCLSVVAGWRGVGGDAVNTIRTMGGEVIESWAYLKPAVLRASIDTVCDLDMGFPINQAL